MWRPSGIVISQINDWKLEPLFLIQSEGKTANSRCACGGVCLRVEIVLRVEKAFEGRGCNGLKRVEWSDVVLGCGCNDLELAALSRYDRAKAAQMPTVG